MLSKLLLPAVLALDLIFSPLSSAHLRPDPLELAPTAPAAGAQSETVSGTVGELVIADHVAGMTVRHVFILPHDGRAATTLAGTGVGALRQGAEISVTGRRNGDTLFVERAKATKRAPSSVDAATDRVEGRLLFLHSDDFETGRSSYHYEVHGHDGKVTGLRLHVLPESLQPGMIVAAAGRRDTGSEDLEPSQIDIYALAAATTDEEARVAAKATVAHSVLVTLLEFADTTTDPMPASTAQQVMTTNTGSVANFFREDVFRPAYVERDRHAVGALHDAVDTDRLRVDPVVADPAGCRRCREGGRLRRDLRVPRLRVSADRVVRLGGPRLRRKSEVGVHQRRVGRHDERHRPRDGPRLRAAPRRSRDCGAAAIGGTCTSPSMATRSTRWGRAIRCTTLQRRSCCWAGYPPDRCERIRSGSAIYTISPLELGGGTTYAVKVPVATQRTYWLEYRQPLGFDAGLTTYSDNGVQIRLAAPFELSCSGAPATQLLDPHLEQRRSRTVRCSSATCSRMRRTGRRSACCCSPPAASPCR